MGRHLAEQRSAGKRQRAAAHEAAPQGGLPCQVPGLQSVPGWLFTHSFALSQKLRQILKHSKSFLTLRFLLSSLIRGPRESVLGRLSSAFGMAFRRVKGAQVRGAGETRSSESLQALL